MNRVLIAILTILTFSSCAKNESVTKKNSKSSICFNVSVKSSTKAEDLNLDNFKSFKIFSYLTTDNYIGTSQLGDAYMNNVEVFKNANSKWECEESFYWPIDGRKMQFFAVSSPVDIETSANSYPFFNYTVKAEAEQEDFVASILLNKESLTTEEDINLSFNHILSKINFSIKGEKDGYTYNVAKIEIKDVYSRGVFTFDNSEKVGAWSGQSELTNYAIDLTDFSVNGSVATPVIGENGSLILMPQKNDEGFKVVVTYNVIRNSDNFKVFDGSKEILLSSTDWEVGSNIDYTLNLSIGDFPEYKIELSETYVNLLTSALHQLFATLSPVDYGAVFYWESSNPYIISVDQDGFLNRHSGGIVTISAKYKNAVGTCQAEFK
ncbi:MAG: fimbrillin family protein [Bacteroidetes bacterium]|nr:fimbrillin family protein [Bacteroidota bacterium]